MSKPLGTIGLRFCGQWEPGKFYRKDDWVTHNRSSFACRVDHTSSDEFDSEQWQVLADAQEVEQSLADMQTAKAAAEAATEAAVEATTAANEQAEYAREQGEAAHEQAEAAREATGIFTENINLMTNDKYVYAITDSEGNLLWGIDKDGVVYEPKGIGEDVRKRLAELAGIQVMKNDQYGYAIVDSKDNILFAIDHKGATMVNAITGVCEVEQFETGSEYMFAVMDSQQNFLFGIKRDGTFAAAKMELPPDIIAAIASATSSTGTGSAYVSTERDDNQYIYKIQDKDGQIVFAIRWDGTTVIPKGISDEQQLVNNRVSRAMSDLERKLKNFTGGTGDWSKSKKLHLPIPRCAMLNILTNINLSSLNKVSRGGVPGVNCELPCEVEFWDGQGNYFKKWSLLSAQGNSSMAFIKKNLAIDFYNSKEDALNDDSDFKVKFGDWVPQSSYHFKAYYTDAFRGKGTVSYMLYEEMVRTRGFKEERPYMDDYTGLYTMSDVGVDSPVTEVDKNFPTGAKCFPYGFPVIVYQNGEFYGVYAMQLKKHRDNFMMDKKTAEHVHLDGTIGADSMFGGNINWTQFEVRNPKSLYMQEQQTIMGEETIEYNGDFPREIMGSDSEHYVSSDKNMKRCDKVKTHIERLSHYVPELKAAESAIGTTTLKNVLTALKGNHTHSSSTGLNALSRGVAFIGNDEWLVYLTKDDTGVTDVAALNFLNGQFNTAMGVAQFAEYNSATITSRTVKVHGDGAVDGEAINAMLAEMGLVGYTMDFNGTTGKVYPTGTNISLVAPDATWCYLKVVNVHDVYQSIDTYLTQSRVDMRAMIAERFKVSYMIDYILETNLMNDGDGYNKNWQWVTWDGIQWTAQPYDHDGVCGAFHIGIWVSAPPSGWLGTSKDIPSGWIIDYFLPEMEARYAQLRQLGIFDAKHFANLLKDWVERIGEDNFEAEFKKWNETPCNRPSHINADYWTRSGSYLTSWTSTTVFALNGLCYRGGKAFKSLIAGNVGNDPLTDTENWLDVTWNPETTYQTGETTYYGKNMLYPFKALQTCTGEAPITQFYTQYPQELGHYDSVYRVYNWVVKRVEYMDKLLSYNQ